MDPVSLHVMDCALPVRKVYAPGLRPRMFANPKRVSTRTLRFEQLEEIVPTLVEASAKGAALLGGPPKGGAELKDESRAGKIDTTAPVSVMRLDFDGAPNVRRTDEKIRGPALEPADCLFPAARRMLDLIGLNGAPALVHWSAGARIKPGLRFHALVPLAEPKAPKAVKNWMWSVNTGPLRKAQRLTDSGLALAWVLDPTLADNAHVLYLGDPKFEDPTEDPFAGENRWQVL